jgi:hypothetical protein
MPSEECQLRAARDRWADKFSRAFSIRRPMSWEIPIWLFRMGAFVRLEQSNIDIFVNSLFFQGGFSFFFLFF